MNPVTYEILTRRVRQLANLPAMPALLNTLCETLSQNPQQVDVEKVVETISYDKSLAAQCLCMANSALYHQRGDVATVRDAVFTLGLWHIRDLAFSCSLPLMFAGPDCAVAKEAFWRHALATAVLSQKLGANFASRSEQIYLSGLLHDIGLLINAFLFPDDFRLVMEAAVQERVAVAVVEQRILGFTHAESGRIAAELWKLPVEVANVIEFHHRPGDQQANNEVTVVVQVANQLCWQHGLGYGYEIPAYESTSPELLWQTLVDRFPRVSRHMAEDYSVVLESHMAAARELTDQVFGPATRPQPKIVPQIPSISR